MANIPLHLPRLLALENNLPMQQDIRSLVLLLHHPIHHTRLDFITIRIILIIIIIILPIKIIICTILLLIRMLRTCHHHPIITWVHHHLWSCLGCNRIISIDARNNHNRMPCILLQECRSSNKHRSRIARRERDKRDIIRHLYRERRPTTNNSNRMHTQRTVATRPRMAQYYHRR